MKILEVLTKRRLTGNLGEDAATDYLRKRGYKILQRNYVAQGHEIDIIARCRDALCFIEVKTRTLGKESLKEPRPASSVTPEKQRSIISCAKVYAAFEGRGKKLRFDVIEVLITADGQVHSINHMEAAFNADTAGRGTYNNIH